MPYNIIIAIPSFLDENTGIGGHYRSLLTLQNILSEKNYCTILSYGNLPPPVYNNLPDTRHISTKSKLFISELKKEIKYLIRNQTHKAIIISLSPRDLFTLSLVCINTESSLVYCKPGGPPRKSDDFLSKLPSILFNGRDDDYFKLKNPSATNFLFSSRVLPPNEDQKLSASFLNKSAWREWQLKNKKKCLIICRITQEKDDFISKACEALSQLKEELISIVFVGHVQDEIYFEKIRMLYPLIQFITTEKYTTNAASLFHVADLSVCIGRTAQESISLGVPTFIPISYNNETRLTLACEEIIAPLIKHNFTTRVSESHLELPNNLIHLEQLLISPTRIAEARVKTYALFEKKLSYKTQLEAAENFISKLPTSPRKYFFAVFFTFIYFQFRQQAKKVIPYKLGRIIKKNKFTLSKKKLRSKKI